MHACAAAQVLSSACRYEWLTAGGVERHAIYMANGRSISTDRGRTIGPTIPMNVLPETHALQKLRQFVSCVLCLVRRCRFGEF